MEIRSVGLIIVNVFPLKATRQNAPATRVGAHADGTMPVQPMDGSTDEHRVAITPDGVHEMADHGVTVVVGMLLTAAREWGVSLRASTMVGDRWRDIEAGQRAGCRCLFVDHGYAEQQPAGSFVRVPSLAAAAEWILENQ